MLWYRMHSDLFIYGRGRWFRLMNIEGFVCFSISWTSSFLFHIIIGSLLLRVKITKGREKWWPHCILRLDLFYVSVPFSKRSDAAAQSLQWQSYLCIVEQLKFSQSGNGHMGNQVEKGKMRRNFWFSSVARQLLCQIVQNSQNT